MHSLIKPAILGFVFAFIALNGNLVTGAEAPPATSAEATPSDKTTAHAEAPTTAPHEEEHGLTQHAVEVARPFGFPITNSMVVSWVVALGLIVFAQVATRRMERVPAGAQNF